MLKNICVKIKKLFNQIVSKFPITMIGVLILTLIFAFIVENDIINHELLEKIIMFINLATLGNFYIETKNSGLNKLNCSKYIISSFIAVVFTILCSNILKLDNQIFINSIDNVLKFYIISIILLVIFESFKQSKLSLGEYTIKVITSVFKSIFIYGILAISSLIILGIFSSLIFFIEWDVIGRIEILIVGIFLIPRLLYSLSDIEKGIGNFIKIIFKYTLEILLIIDFSIIYLYMAKILILVEIPSNEIFRILAGLFAIGCPIWTIVEHFNNKDLLSRINAKLPILFIPFIILQIYAISVRINQYGLTEARYLACALIIFEIIYYIIYFKNKENISNMFIVGIVMAFVILVVPYINVHKLPILVQYNILKSYKEKSNITDEDYKKIKGAYYYLRDDAEGKQMIKNLLKEEDIYNILNKSNENKENQFEQNHLRTENIYASSTEETISIGGYNVLKNVEYNEKDIDKIKQINSTFDIYKALNLYIENEKNIDTYFNNNNKIIIDNDNKLI